MSLQTDAIISLKKETTFGTGVTVDTSYPFTDEDLQYLPEWVQGVGQSGDRLAGSAERVLVRESVGGSFTTELRTKGMGKLFEAALGVAESNQISGAAYQQLITPLADDYLPSYTIQKGIPLLGSDISPHTFAGMVCAGFEMSAASGGIPTVKWNWVGKSLATATALAAGAYPAATTPFAFLGGSLRIGGSVTPPTTTALASGGTAAANIRSFDLTYDNGLDTEGFNFGANGQRSRKPVVALRSITGNLVAEYDSNTLRDAWIAGTDLAMVLKFATATAITGSHYPAVEITIPVVRLEGEIPQATRDGSATTQSIDFTALEGRVAAHPIYVAIVTAETAI